MGLTFPVMVNLDCFPHFFPPLKKSERELCMNTGVLRSQERGLEQQIQWLLECLDL